MQIHFIITFIFTYYNSIFFVSRAKIFLVIYLKLKKFFSLSVQGVGIGLVNGIFGAGGGMLAVPFLKKSGLDQKSAHANAVAVILPITVISAILYLIKGNVVLSDSFIYIPTGLIGSVAATFLLQKFSNSFLQKVFAIFMIYAGVRLLTR